MAGAIAVTTSNIVTPLTWRVGLNSIGQMLLLHEGVTPLTWRVGLNEISLIINTPTKGHATYVACGSKLGLPLGFSL